MFGSFSDLGFVGTGVAKENGLSGANGFGNADVLINSLPT